jgi:SAM-dependent methyltransferase
MSAEVTQHWGSEAVDPREHSLPGLKAHFLLDRVPETGRVIELGCGEGKMLRTLALHRPELELHGCDVREPLAKGDSYQFHRMKDGRAPLEGGSFDAVLIMDVLEHVPDPEAMLAETARLLRPGGKLVAVVPVEGERLSFYELFRMVLGRDTYVVTKEHIQAFTHRGLASLLGRYFELNHVRYAYHPLGQLMDAGFFAAAKLRSVRDFWWKENVYYNAEGGSHKGARAMNKLLQAGNVLAWAESKGLSQVRLGACAVLVDGTVRGRSNS